MFCRTSPLSRSFCVPSLFRKGDFCLISIQSFLFVFSSDCSFNFHSSQTFLSSLPGLFSWSQTQKAEITLPVCKKEQDS